MEIQRDFLRKINLGQKYTIEKNYKKSELIDIITEMNKKIKKDENFIQAQKVYIQHLESEFNENERIRYINKYYNDINDIYKSEINELKIQNEYYLDNIIELKKYNSKYETEINELNIKNSLYENKIKILEDDIKLYEEEIENHQDMFLQLKNKYELGIRNYNEKNLLLKELSLSGVDPDINASLFEPISIESFIFNDEVLINNEFIFDNDIKFDQKNNDETSSEFINHHLTLSTISES